MAYRATKSGIAADIQKKMESKMSELEAEGVTGYIVQWINAVLASDPSVERISGNRAENLHVALKDGVSLLKVVNLVRTTVQLPPLKIEVSKSKIPSMAQAKHFDNLGRFLQGAEDLGMKVNDLFQSGDLYEGSRAQMVNVVNSLHSFGLLSKSLHFSPGYGGPGNYATENVRGFSAEEVRAQSSSIVSKQLTGSHGGASQAGMRAPGTSRHIAEAGEIRPDGTGILSKQTMGSHGGASQVGMRAPGTSRHITEAGEIRPDGTGILSKQSLGSHGGASQAGMRAPGTSRHIAD